MESVLLRPPGQFRRAIGTFGLVAAALTIPAWFLAFPLGAQFDAAAALRDGATLLAAMVGYACFARVGARFLEAGWFLVAYSALLALLAGFTIESVAWERWPATLTRLGGTLLILVGGVRFTTRPPRGRAHRPGTVVHPGSDLRPHAPGA
jgi:peptidoglycan/LPS O-acetylase OafA/YrhL